MPSAGSRKFSSGNQINIELHQNLVFTNHKFELCWHFLGYPIEVDQKPQAAAGKAEHHCPDQGLIGSPVKNSAMRTLPCRMAGTAFSKIIWTPRVILTTSWPASTAAWKSLLSQSSSGRSSQRVSSPRDSGRPKQSELQTERKTWD